MFIVISDLFVCACNLSFFCQNWLAAFLFSWRVLGASWLGDLEVVGWQLLAAMVSATLFVGVEAGLRLVGCGMVLNGGDGTWLGEPRGAELVPM